MPPETRESVEMAHSPLLWLVLLCVGGTSHCPGSWAAWLEPHFVCRSPGTQLTLSCLLLFCPQLTGVWKLVKRKQKHEL